MNKNQNETTGRMMRPVAYIKSDFTSKFGIPRQSGLADLEAEIHFYPEYQNPEAVRGLEEYSHLWLIWEFSQAIRKEWSPTVRPPKLGGNTRVGVLPPAPRFVPIRSGSPVCSLQALHGILRMVRSSISRALIFWTEPRSTTSNPTSLMPTATPKHVEASQPLIATTTFRYNSRRNS